MPKNKNYIETLHQNATPSTFQNAHDLRHNETNTEKKLWQLIRNRQINGRKFRRQHAIDNYILDFYCHECKLAIELDGSIHNQKENKQYDAARTNVLNELQITVLRFSNEEVINDVESVLKKIADHL